MGGNERGRQSPQQPARDPLPGPYPLPSLASHRGILFPACPGLDATPRPRQAQHQHPDTLFKSWYRSGVSCLAWTIGSAVHWPARRCCLPLAAFAERKHAQISTL